MAITKPQGNYTGLLGYDRTYEYFGESLPFRVVENFSYEVYDNQLDQTADLPAYFKTQFAAQLNLFSGDVDITSLEYPNSPDLKEDGVRLQKYNITLQSRRTDSFFNSSSDGYANVRNSGLSSVVTDYFDILKEFSESFGFTRADDGKRNYQHTLNFSLRTGDNTTGTAGLHTAAQQIASAVFDVEDGTNLSVIGFSDYGDFTSTDAKQYLTESFDDLAHSYNFEKTREILPFDSGNYNHSINHSIRYGDDGYFQITESLSVMGKAEYSQALAGFNSLVDGASGRCTSKITQYDSIVNRQTSDTSTSVSSDVQQVRISKTHKIPDLMVEGQIVFTNDPSYFDNITKSDEMVIEREANGVIQVNHSYSYNLFDFVDGATDTKTVSGSKNIVELMTGDRAASQTICQNVYDQLTGLTGRDNPSALALISTNITSPVRGKNYSAQFSYSDSPMYDLTRITDPFTQSQVTGFTMLEVSVDETEPKDIIEEYKVINRQSKQSVLSYGYQQEPGSAKVSCRGQMTRATGNRMGDFRLPTGEAIQLLKYSKGHFLDHVMYDKRLYNYYLQGASYSFGSDNSFNLGLDFVYTKKGER